MIMSLLTSSLIKVRGYVLVDSVFRKGSHPLSSVYDESIREIIQKGKELVNSSSPVTKIKKRKSYIFSTLLCNKLKKIQPNLRLLRGLKRRNRLFYLKTL